ILKGGGERLSRHPTGKRARRLNTLGGHPGVRPQAPPRIAGVPTDHLYGARRGPYWAWASVAMLESTINHEIAAPTNAIANRPSRPRVNRSMATASAAKIATLASIESASPPTSPNRWISARVPADSSRYRPVLTATQVVNPSRRHATVARRRIALA